METFLVRVWVPAPGEAGPFPGPVTLHGLVQHVGKGPAVQFSGVGQLLTLVETALKHYDKCDFPYEADVALPPSLQSP